MQSAHACACFVEVALFPKKYEQFRNLTNKGAILDCCLARNCLKIQKKLHLCALGVQNGGSGSVLGCKMEGKGSV